MTTYTERYETLKGEHLKTAMEMTLHTLGSSEVGRFAIEHYAFGLEKRINDTRLHTDIAGVQLENPIMVGAGWDKKGKSVVGLYSLGFSGVEVGTVPLFGQPGQLRPRMWTINSDHSVANNRMGFNTPGAEAVGRNLDAHEYIPGVIGINIGKNKDLKDAHSAEYHALAVGKLIQFADYVVFNPSSPNTENLRLLQAASPLRDHLQAMREETMGKPLWAKFAPDISYEQLDESVEVAIEEGAAGVILANTTVNQGIKAKYGTRWANEAGGLSGDDYEYRKMTTDMIRHVYEEYGDELEIIGVGGIKDGQTALEKIKAGASAIQVVTAIRPSLGRVASKTNRDIVDYMEREGMTNVKELIGLDTNRGVRAA